MARGVALRGAAAGFCGALRGGREEGLDFGGGGGDELGRGGEPAHRVGFEGDLVVVAFVVGFAGLDEDFVVEVVFDHAVEESVGAVEPLLVLCLGFVRGCGDVRDRCDLPGCTCLQRRRGTGLSCSSM